MLSVEDLPSGYRTDSLHVVPVEYDQKLLTLMKEVSGFGQDMNALRASSVHFHNLHAARRLDFLQPWQLTTVLLKNGEPIGLFAAHFKPEGAAIRVKEQDGARLLTLPPYVNIGPSVLELPSAEGACSQLWQTRA